MAVNMGKRAHWQSRESGRVAHRITRDGARVARWSLVMRGADGNARSHTVFVVARIGDGQATITHVRTFRGGAS